MRPLTFFISPLYNHVRLQQFYEAFMVTCLALAVELLTTRVGVEVTKFFKPRLGISCTNHWYLLIQSQQCKEQSSLQNLSKVNNKYIRKTSMTHSAHVPVFPLLF